MKRRGFVKTCLVATATTLGHRLARSIVEAREGPSHAYARVLLVNPQGVPMKASQLTPHENHLFFYPYRSTPCFLLNLDTEVGGAVVHLPTTGKRYQFSGGVGPRRSIVAYTAICPHQWTHPEPTMTSIRYHGPNERFVMVRGEDKLITCCAHGSAFDPFMGGRIVQSPAELPLAAIDLEWNQATDGLMAQGLLGPDSFDRFFATFNGKSREFIQSQATVVRLEEFSRTVLRC